MTFLIIGQVICILIAYCMAKHDVVPVNYFRNYGIDTSKMKEFHGSNAFTKFFIILGLSLFILFNPHAWLLNYFFDALIMGLVNFLWLGLVFDIVLNISREGDFKWDYIGTNDITGKFLLRIFRKRAGKVKAIICVVGIVILNILHFFLK